MGEIRYNRKIRVEVLQIVFQDSQRSQLTLGLCIEQTFWYNR